ncbi:MAG: hypothetical protein ACKO9Z_03500 [Planctomycetota bacterium]
MARVPVAQAIITKGKSSVLRNSIARDVVISGQMLFLFLVPAELSLVRLVFLDKLVQRLGTFYMDLIVRLSNLQYICQSFHFIIHF